MSDKAAGWYPDPDGENRQRYWDGDSWTAYFAPIAPPAPELHGPATATADYPYLAAARHGQHADLMARPGDLGSQQATGWPAAAAATPRDGDTLEFTGGGRRAGGSRWMLVTVSVLVVALVVTIGIWLLGDTSGDDPSDPTATTPTGPGPTSSGDPVPLDGSATGDVGGFGVWESSLNLDADTLLTIDVRADRSGADLELTLRPQGGGDPVASNDDRGGALASTSGNALDPLLIATVPAGEYALEVANRDGDATDFELTATTISTEIPLSTSVNGTVPESGAFTGYVPVPSDGAYDVDVLGLSADDGDTADPVLVMVGPEGEQLVNDDRSADDANPLLEETLSSGTWVVLVLDYRGRSIDIEIEVTPV